MMHSAAEQETSPAHISPRKPERRMMPPWCPSRRLSRPVWRGMFMLVYASLSLFSFLTGGVVCGADVYSAADKEMFIATKHMPRRRRRRRRRGSAWGWGWSRR